MPRLSNPQHEIFAQLVVQGYTLTDAYTKVRGRAKNANGGGCGWRKRADIDGRIQELANENVAKVQFTREQIIERLCEMLEMAPKDASLASKHCDVRYVGKEAVPVPITTDRLKTIERLARIQGWDREVVEHTAAKEVLEALDAFHDPDGAPDDDAA